MFSSIEVYVSIYVYILQSDIFICRSLYINIRLYNIVTCFHLQKTMYQYTPIFNSQMFSSVEAYVLIFIYILWSDTFIYRSLCINIRLYIIVRCVHLQNCIYQYISIFYSQMFSSIEIYVSMYIEIFQSDAFICKSLCITIRLYFIVT